MLLFLLIFIVPVAADQSSVENNQSSDSTYFFGIFPFVSLSRIEEIFAPVAVELETALNKKIQLRSSSSFENFSQRLANKSYDIAFIQPFDYVKTAAKVGYKPLVARSELLSALIVVTPDSNVEYISDLNGKIIALPPKGAAVSYLGAISWQEAGHDLERYSQTKYVNSHDSCLQLLLIGEVSACVTAQGPLTLFESKANFHFRIVAKSPSIPGSLYVTHPDMPDTDRLIIKNKMLSLSPTSTAAAWPISQGRPYRSVADSDYDVLRKYLEYIQE